MKDRSALRLATLQETLANGGTLHLRDAAELCGVSEMTIRRDVNAHPHVISLLGGRLVMAHTPGVTPVYDLTEQQASHYQAKPLMPTSSTFHRGWRYAICRLRFNAHATNEPVGQLSRAHRDHLCPKRGERGSPFAQRTAGAAGWIVLCRVANVCQ